MFTEFHRPKAHLIFPHRFRYGRFLSSRRVDLLVFILNLCVVSFSSFQAKCILLSKSSSRTEGVGEFPRPLVATVDLLGGCSPTSCSQLVPTATLDADNTYIRLSELQYVLDKRKNADLSVSL